MAETNKNTDAALKISEQVEYYRLLKEAPIEEFAQKTGISIDEAVSRRIEEVIKSVPPKLDVIVRPIEPKGNLLGFASVKFYDGIIVDDFKVLRGEKGLFVGMPSKTDTFSKTGYKDVARIVNAEFRVTLTKEIITEYYAAVERLQVLAAAVKDRQSIKQQIENGKVLVAKENVTKSTVTKGNKSKNIEI